MPPRLGARRHLAPAGALERHRLYGQAASRTGGLPSRVSQRPSGALYFSPALVLAIRLQPVAKANCLTVLPCGAPLRSEEHSSEIPSLMRISYAAFCFT